MRERNAITGEIISYEDERLAANDLKNQVNVRYGHYKGFTGAEYKQEAAEVEAITSIGELYEKGEITMKQYDSAEKAVKAYCKTSLMTREKLEEILKKITRKTLVIFTAALTGAAVA